MQYGDPRHHCPWPTANQARGPVTRGPTGGDKGGRLFPPGHLKNWKEDRMRPHGTRFLTLTAVAASAAMALASCSLSSSSSGIGGSKKKGPPVFGKSLSLTGGLSLSGPGFVRG